MSLGRPFACKDDQLLSAPLTAQAATCFLCLALVAINSTLAMVQEHLFLGDAVRGCLHQNFIPLLSPSRAKVPVLRFQAWCHSPLAHVQSSPWRGQNPHRSESIRAVAAAVQALKIMSYSQNLLFACAKVMFLFQIKY